MSTRGAIAVMVVTLASSASGQAAMNGPDSVGMTATLGQLKPRCTG